MEIKITEAIDFGTIGANVRYTCKSGLSGNHLIVRDQTITELAGEEARWVNVKFINCELNVTRARFENCSFESCGVFMHSCIVDRYSRFRHSFVVADNGTDIRASRFWKTWLNKRMETSSQIDAKY